MVLRVTRALLVIAMLLLPAGQALAASSDSQNEYVSYLETVPAASHIDANAALVGEYGEKAVAIGDISAVPLSAAFWLFGSALIGFIGISRRTCV